MMFGKKVSYQAIVGLNLGKRSLGPGDEIALVLRNEDGDIYDLCRRLKDAFLKSFCFYPQSISIHPDHLDILKKQGRSLEILIKEDAADILGDIMDMTTIPRKVDLLGDETLDLFTARASYIFEVKEAANMMMDIMESFM